MSLTTIATAIIFILTYTGVSLGRIPGFRLDRAGIALTGAALLASNVGSTATITGNPQNMIVGAVSRVPYTTFAAALTPVALVGLLLVVVLLAALWRGEFRRPAQLTTKPFPPRLHKPQLIKAVFVTLGVIVAFFAGVPVAVAAFLGGALLLVTRAIKAHKVYHEIDGSLLLMFAGLFVVVAAAEKKLLTPEVISSVQALHLDNVYVLTAVTAVLSNIISNVPAVLALKPFVLGLTDQHRIWLVIAMSATLAGNLTLVGSVANLIVAERAKTAGIEVSFWAYCRAGIPLTIITLAIGAWWLS